METTNKSNTNPLKRIDFTQGWFMANGTKYTIESSLSIERFCEFQILEKELGFGISFKGIFDKLMEMKKLLDKLKFVAAITILLDLIRGVAKVQEREPTALKMAALFINSPDENRAIWNNDILTQKLNDWKAEGLDYKDFFTVASGSVSGLYEVYLKVTRNISEILEDGLKSDPTEE